MDKQRKYKCAECKMEFEIDYNNKSPKCPECGNKTLILLKGDPRRKKSGCAPSG